MRVLCSQLPCQNMVKCTVAVDLKKIALLIIVLFVFRYGLGVFQKKEYVSELLPLEFFHRANKTAAMNRSSFSISTQLQRGVILNRDYISNVVPIVDRASHLHYFSTIFQNPEPQFGFVLFELTSAPNKRKYHFLTG